MNDEVVNIRLGSTEPLKVGNRVFKSAFDWELSEKDLEIAACELGETEERKKDCLRKLKEKFSRDINVKYRQDDFYLLRYLRVRKFDVKKAYQNARLFLQYRKNNLNLITIPSDLKFVQQLNCVTILPYADEEGRIILLLNFGKWNPDEFSFEDIARAAINVLDIASMNPHSQINGVIYIFDLSGITLRHFSEILSNGRLWTCTSAIQNGFPWRIKKWYVLNTNRLARLLYNLIKPVLHRKIAERGFLLGSDMHELHQHVNPALLPKSLNGTLEEKECDTSQHVLNNLPYFRFERSFGFQ